jgi:hypothetical protein
MSEISYLAINPHVVTHEKSEFYVHCLTLSIINAYKTGPAPVSTAPKFLTTNFPVESNGKGGVAGGVKCVRLSRLGGWRMGGREGRAGDGSPRTGDGNNVESEIFFLSSMGACGESRGGT